MNIVVQNHKLINQDSGNAEWYRKITRNSLKNAKARCFNPNNPAYHNYGGRGISVSTEWLGKRGLDNLIRDIGFRPSEQHSLDRIDVNGDYSKDNCKWSTRKEQSNNRRDTVYVGEETLASVCERLGITQSRGFHLYKNGFDFSSEPPEEIRPIYLEINGEVKTLTVWCNINNVSYRLAYGRLKRGWNIDEIFKSKYQSKLYEHNGCSKTLKAWCRDYNVAYKKVHYRINTLKWDLDKALTTK